MLANRRQKIIYGLIFGLIGGLIYGPIGGLIYGLKTDISNRVKPNQGIWTSFKSAFVLLAAAFLFVILLRLGLTYVFGSPPYPQEVGPTALFLFPLILCLPAYKAGQACIQHFSLRLVLCRTHAIPWNYARFLNHCTELLLLQRVGDRYRFIHRLIQARFAAMPLGPMEGLGK